MGGAPGGLIWLLARAMRSALVAVFVLVGALAASDWLGAPAADASDRAAQATSTLAIPTALPGLTGTATWTPVSGMTWTMRPSLATARTGMGIAVANGGLIYTFGGVATGNVPSNAVDEYTPATGGWRSRAAMPTKRTNFAAAAASNGKIYVVGAYSPLPTMSTLVEEYDPVTDAWRTRAPMPTGRSGLALVASGDRLYAIGGSSVAVTGATALATVEEYDPATDTWRARSPMAGPRGQLGAATLPGGLIYAVGGARNVTSAATILASMTNAVEEYDPVADAWRPRRSMPTSRFAVSAAGGPNGRLYAVGGSVGLSISTVEEYDPGTDTWIARASMPDVRDLVALASVGTTLHAIGGSSNGTPVGLVADASEPGATVTPTLTATATLTPTATMSPTTTATRTETATRTAIPMPSGTPAPVRTTIPPTGGIITPGPEPGAVGLEIAPGAVGRTTVFEFFPRPLPSPTGNTIPIAAFQLLAAQGAVTRFDADVTIVVRYDPAALGDLDEQSLAVYVRNFLHERLPSTVDPDTRTVRAITRHFTEFELSGGDLPTPTPRAVSAAVPTTISGWVRMHVPAALLRGRP